jgi:hypothetical protein
MTEEPPVEEATLHAEVVAPRQRRRTIVIAGVGCLIGTTIGTLACVLWLPPRIRTVVLTPPPERVLEVREVQVPIAPTPVPRTSEVQLVFSIAGETYVAIDTLELPKHGTPTLIESEPDLVASIATVAAKDLPGDARAWRHRTVSVDGTCEARVTGFAVIGRLSGNASDASDQLTSWTADSVLEYGRPTLAARLDGCTGTFARDATLPAITVLADTNAPGDLAERARERFAASDLVTSTQDVWRGAGNEGTWYEASDAHVDTHVMRHPRTGVMWVVVHAYRYGDCGEVGGNVVGIYRVEHDGSLATVQVRQAGMAQLDHVIDLEGDGELELAGSGPRETMIDRANGDEVLSLGVMSYGCGC